MRAIGRLYVSREKSARYDWHLVLGTAVLAGAPILAGVLADQPADGVQASLGAWFTAIAIPEPHVTARARQLMTRTALLTAATCTGSPPGTGWRP
jgi:hypothetical protein